MNEMDDLRRALRHDPEPSKREIRAAATRAQVLSPTRIVLSLVTLPLLAVGVAVSLYLRMSEYDPPDALAHLVARVSCDAAQSVGLAPSYRGELGYHARNDANGDGVACALPDGSGPVRNAAISEPVAIQDTSARMVGGAKFVKP